MFDALWRLARSRKVLVALGGLIAAVGAEFGLQWDAERIIAIMGLTGVIIAGIAGEDIASKLGVGKGEKQ